MTGGPSVMTNVTVSVSEPAPLLEVMVAVLNVPTVVGVPDIRPVVGFTVRPGGRFAALNEVGAKFAVIWKL